MKSLFGFSLIIFYLICSSCSCTDKSAQKFTLQGEINGQDSGIIILTYMPGETRIYDTAKVEKGKFVFKGMISETVQATLRDGNDEELAVVYLEPQKMDISIFKDKPSWSKMTGSKTQDDFDLLQKSEKPFYDRISVLRSQYNTINDSIKNSKNDSTKILLENKVAEIDKLWSRELKKIDSTAIKFVIENPKSFLAIAQLRMLEANEAISLDSAKSIFNGLDNSLRKSRYGKDIAGDIRKKENIRIGNQAPDFKATDLNQQTVTLSQFKGESVVLMDFWASWCVPCRESIPHLKTLYKKYHSRGFEVIAVSQDYNRNPWIDAVKQDSTGVWFHIPVAEKWPCRPDQLTNDDIYQNYFVQAIPVTMLIDKNGRIVYRHVGYSKESEASLDKQLSQLFD